MQSIVYRILLYVRSDIFTMPTPIWNYFRKFKLNGEDKAECHSCKQILSATKGSPTRRNEITVEKLLFLKYNLPVVSFKY